jgi:nicotinic acid mononucleotide adenylyltransferase
MGADSWADIKTWKEWENVLLTTSHIVVSRPGYEIDVNHVTDNVRSRIVDLRGLSDESAKDKIDSIDEKRRIFLTDAVKFDISATEIREDVRSDSVLDRTDDVPTEVAKYIEKYELYR